MARSSRTHSRLLRRALRGWRPSRLRHLPRDKVACRFRDSLLVEFASAVDAVRAATDIQRAMAIRNADFVADKRIEFRIGAGVRNPSALPAKGRRPKPFSIAVVRCDFYARQESPKPMCVGGAKR